MQENIPSVVEFRRGGRIESLHRFHASVVDSAGNMLYSCGDPNYSTFLRSSTKPIQAMAAILSGAYDRFNLTLRELAIIAGSHGGEKIHTNNVTSILKKIGLTVENLQTGVHPPLNIQAREELYASGEQPSCLHNNCSGKHSGMLASAIALHASTDTYLEVDHPVQKMINEIVSLLSEVDVNDIWFGIDGCSAPVHGVPMLNGAWTFAKLVDPSMLPDRYRSAAEKVCKAMMTYPEMVGASQNSICTELIRHGKLNSLIAKGGAEGYYLAGWFDSKLERGIGMSIKVEDGNHRAREPIVIAILQKLGVLPIELPESLKPFAARDIMNHKGTIVGEILVQI